MSLLPLLIVDPLHLGMVSACSGCDLLEPWAALIVGAGAGLIYLLVSFLVERARIDDPLNAVAGNCSAIHLVSQCNISGLTTQDYLPEFSNVHYSENRISVT